MAKAVVRFFITKRTIIEDDKNAKKEMRKFFIQENYTQYIT
jgi:hypothetical protein